jgi:hypothetical protein
MAATRKSRNRWPATNPRAPTDLYDRRNDAVALDEAERVVN